MFLDHPLQRYVIEPYLSSLTPIGIAETIELTTPLDLKPTPCPVNPENSERWTAKERDSACQALEPGSLEDLEELVSGISTISLRLKHLYI